MRKKIIILGGGLAGMAAAAYLAKDKHEVIIYEKNPQLGGRNYSASQNGFTFDKGPSWYWMPDIFESFFSDFGKKPSDYYNLIRLNPSYKVFFQNESHLIPADLEELKQLFDKIEPGAGKQLTLFLKEAGYKYEIGMKEYVYKPALSIFEYFTPEVMTSVFKMDLFSSMTSHIKKYFKNTQLIQLLEFPVLFLGAKPENTPALYSMMNFADIQLGTWYPMGGLSKVSEGMAKLIAELGVTVHLNADIKRIEVENDKTTGIWLNDEFINADFVIGAGDYHHIETNLLPVESQSYSNSYWNSRKLAPSCLLYYIGVNKKLSNLEHHNLFFDADFKLHAKEIYDTPEWPTNPLFYVCMPSYTDKTVAPQGCENLFILIPTAPDLKENKEIQERYLDMIIKRIEEKTNQEFKQNIIVKECYGYTNFVKDYHSFKGNAYGLANTLTQTAILKPSLKSKKVENLFYAGQLSVPGPGMPPSIISGKLSAELVLKAIHKNKL